MNISISSRTRITVRAFFKSRSIQFLLAALASMAVCFAVETKFWQQGDRTDFEKGTLHRLSLRSDGRMERR